MLCSHNPPKAVGDSRFWKCNLGCLTASLKTKVAAIASLSLLWTECHLHTVYTSSSLWLVLLHSSCSHFREVAHQPDLAVPQASEQHSTVGAALEMLEKCSVDSQRIFFKEATAFLCEPCPVDGSVGCFLLKRGTKPLLRSPHDLSNVWHRCSDAVFSKAW